MTDKDFLKLQSLNNEIMSCRACYLNINGVHKPTFSSRSKYAMLLKSPMVQGESYYNNLEKITKEFGLSISDFMILGSVQCSCINKGKPINPSELHRRVCYDWVEQYITIAKPEKIIAFGNIPMHTLIGKFDGIMEKNATVNRVKIGGHVAKVVLSVCPSSMTYGEKYVEMVKASFQKFVEI